MFISGNIKSYNTGILIDGNIDTTNSVSSIMVDCATNDITSLSSGTFIPGNGTCSI